MTTKKLYGILDKVLPAGLCYNLRKMRNMDYWRVRIWNSKELDKKGILAPWVEDILYLSLYEIDEIVLDFMRICKLA